MASASHTLLEPCQASRENAAATKIMAPASRDNAENMALVSESKGYIMYCSLAIDGLRKRGERQLVSNLPWLFANRALFTLRLSALSRSYTASLVKKKRKFSS
jgi:hypothetical protein